MANYEKKIAWMGLIVWILMMLAPSLVPAKDDVVMEKATIDGIACYSGGFGKEDRKEMRAFEKNYNVKLVFTVAATGKYYADIPVKITSKDNTVNISTQAIGPWFYAKLPPGEYEIKADFDDRERTRTVRTGNSMRTVVFGW